jgi:hypothetical protein
MSGANNMTLSIILKTLMETSDKVTSYTWNPEFFRMCTRVRIIRFADRVSEAVLANQC